MEQYARAQYHDGQHSNRSGAVNLFSDPTGAYSG
jgi:hypothetical protein